MDFATAIKTMVSTPNLFEFYGFKRNRAGFVCCPFHGEKTPSMKVYDGAKGFHCFGGCGAHGDVLDFVQRYFNLSFNEALAKINADFHLGLPLEENNKEARRKAMKEADERRKLLEANEREHKRLRKAYDEALAYWIRLDMNKVLYAPKSADEELDPLFVEAVQGLESAAQRLDRAQIELYEFDRKNNF